MRRGGEAEQLRHGEVCVRIERVAVVEAAVVEFGELVLDHRPRRRRSMGEGRLLQSFKSHLTSTTLGRTQIGHHAVALDG